MSNERRFPSRARGLSVEIPSGETLESFDSYPPAREMIHTLIAHGVKAGALSIVGSDVTVVEKVQGKVGYGRAALSAGMSGSWLGLLAGLVFVVVSPTDFVTPVVGGLLIGAGVGMVVGIVLFSSSRSRQRRYRSSQQIIAASYRVVIDAAESASARAALKEHAEHGGD